MIFPACALLLDRCFGHGMWLGLPGTTFLKAGGWVLRQVLSSSTEQHHNYLVLLTPRHSPRTLFFLVRTLCHSFQKDSVVGGLLNGMFPKYIYMHLGKNHLVPTLPYAPHFHSV